MEASFIGFGEAGRALAWPGVRAFDLKTTSPVTREAMLSAYAAAGVEAAEDGSAALVGTGAALSLVTAEQALAAVRASAPFLEADTLWLDMNSVAPATKRRGAELVRASGGRYVDVAIMAPVLPARRSVPVLVAGPHAAEALDFLREAGFENVAIAGPGIGDASAIKMIRSVMVKGIEALTAECVLAASRAGVADAVLTSLDAGFVVPTWRDRADYNLDRMLVHGLRRAAEMEEAANTLVDLGIDPVMTRGTIARQRDLGSLGINPPAGLEDKMIAIDRAREDRAA